MADVSGFSFTFERGRGIVIRFDDKGCPLWHREDDYRRAYVEADDPVPQVDWEKRELIDG